MADYHVTWEIDITADSPEEAAEECRAIQRDPHSTATVFTVTDKDAKTTVDVELNWEAE